MIYYIKGTTINRSVIMQWCGGRESVPSPMVRSPSFRESMPLGCKLHKCFSAFFLPLRWDQMTGADWSWTVPCPGQLSSDNASISQTLVS